MSGARKLSALSRRQLAHDGALTWVGFDFFLRRDRVRFERDLRLEVTRCFNVLLRDRRVGGSTDLGRRLTRGWRGGFVFNAVVRSLFGADD